MLRTTSDGGSSSAGSPALPRSWIGKFRKPRLPKGPHPPGGDAVHRDPALLPPHHEPSSISDAQESSCRELQVLVQRMRSAPSGPNHVDAAYNEFDKIKKQCSALCNTILRDDIRPLRHPASLDSPRSPGTSTDNRSSYSGSSLVDVPTGSAASRPSLGGEHCLAAIRDWKNCLETLAEMHRLSLATTYKNYERDATPEMVDQLFTNRVFRREAVQRMRNTSVARVLSADPQYFAIYEIRFRNFERVKLELSEIRHLLQSGESGISPARPVSEFVISERGDAVLEFANLDTADYASSEPVLRFRVSSQMLAETSPVFARMFSGQSSSLYLHEAEDITDQLPPPPTQYFWKDGSEVKLYRMPQHETNRLQSIEVLLHAAHMHTALVPRDVAFDHFVAIAECSMRYKSTSPLEFVVEYGWLPQWMQRGADAMPDGLLVISYAFGVRELFTRMSKAAILDLVDKQDLQSKPWAQKIKGKIWAVRCAKVAQLHACCISAIQDFVRAPARDPPPDEPEPVSAADLRGRLNMPAAPLRPAAALMGPPRCPRGSHSCDAANLGWLMLMFNEMGVLPQLLCPAVLQHLPEPEPRPRSLAQMADVLRRMPSPPAPIHRGGLCDPSPSFRTAIDDVLSSITGLTLHDISGKSHGWALSKHQAAEPQQLPATGLARLAGPDLGYTVASDFPDNVRLKVLGKLDDIDDVRAAALTSKNFYETYKAHELVLLRRFLPAGPLRGGGGGGGGGSRGLQSLRLGGGRRHHHDELKVLAEEARDMIRQGPGDIADGMTLRSDDSDDDNDDGDLSASDDDSTSVGDGASTPSARTYRHSVGPPGYDSGPPSRGAASATPRQPQPLPAAAAVQDEAPMTDEEAWRILWPGDDADAAAANPAAAAEGVEVLREKFRLGDPSFAEGLEDKTLAVTGEKQLRVERDQCIGLLKAGVGADDKACTL